MGESHKGSNKRNQMLKTKYDFIYISSKADQNNLYLGQWLPLGIERGVIGKGYEGFLRFLSPSIL